MTLTWRASTKGGIELETSEGGAQDDFDFDWRASTKGGASNRRFQKEAKGRGY